MSGEHTSKRSGTTGGTSSQALNLAMKSNVSSSVYSAGKGLGMDKDDPRRNDNRSSI